MIIRTIIAAMLLWSAVGASARVIDLPGNLTIDLPERFKEVENGKFLRWVDSGEEICFYAAPDTASYDIAKCFERFHSMALNLNNFACYEQKTEGLLDLNEDYVDRYMYNLSDKSRLIVRTSHAGGIPYLLLYSYPKDGTPDQFLASAATVRYHGNWWQRLRHLTHQSLAMLIFLPIFLCSAGMVASALLPKKLVVIVILLALYAIGFPMLMREPDTGIAIYAYWTLVLLAFAKLDFTDFNNLVSSVDKSIPG